MTAVRSRGTNASFSNCSYCLNGVRLLGCINSFACEVGWFPAFSGNIHSPLCI